MPALNLGFVQGTVYPSIVFDTDNETDNALEIKKYVQLISLETLFVSYLFGSNTRGDLGHPADRLSALVILFSTDKL